MSNLTRGIYTGNLGYDYKRLIALTKVIRFNQNPYVKLNKSDFVVVSLKFVDIKNEDFGSIYYSLSSEINLDASFLRINPFYFSVIRKPELDLYIKLKSHTEYFSKDDIPFVEEAPYITFKIENFNKLTVRPGLIVDVSSLETLPNLPVGDTETLNNYRPYYFGV